MRLKKWREGVAEICAADAEIQIEPARQDDAELRFGVGVVVWKEPRQGRKPHGRRQFDRGPAPTTRAGPTHRRHISAPHSYRAPWAVVYRLDVEM